MTADIVDKQLANPATLIGAKVLTKDRTITKKAIIQKVTTVPRLETDRKTELPLQHVRKRKNPFVTCIRKNRNNYLDYRAVQKKISCIAWCTSHNKNDKIIFEYFIEREKHPL